VVSHGSDQDIVVQRLDGIIKVARVPANHREGVVRGVRGGLCCGCQAEAWLL
jgi:hypothetical protein